MFVLHFVFLFYLNFRWITFFIIHFILFATRLFNYFFSSKFFFFFLLRYSKDSLHMLHQHFSFYAQSTFLYTYTYSNNRFLKPTISSCAFNFKNYVDFDVIFFKFVLKLLIMLRNCLCQSHRLQLVIWRYELGIYNR